MRKKYPPGIADDLFIRGDAPMTKQEVRAVALSKMKIFLDCQVLDIGAGTGSMSIEAAILAERGKVYAIEKDTNALNLIKENIKNFAIENIEIRVGEAPQCIIDLKDIDRVFIGGSGGKIGGIIEAVYRCLNPGGILCANFILLENCCEAIKVVKSLGFKEIDLIELAIAKGKEMAGKTILEPQRRVFILSAKKDD